MWQFIVGLLIVVIGALITIKSEWFVQNFGYIGWAEAHLGTAGGTRLFYKLLGIVFCLGGFIYMTGLWGSFMMWALSPLIRKS